VSPDGVAIDCRGVRKTYVTPGGSVEALRPADASFQPARLNAVVGPSGCGKSTLLRLIAALDGADTGFLRVGDVDVTALHGHALRGYRRGVVTYVAQRAAANLVCHLRLRDHFPDARSRSMLEPLGLAGHLDSRPEQLSGGEQARAALAIAVARRTPVLLLDEPTAELDRATAEHVLELLVDVAARGTTVVVATHDADLTSAAGTVLDLADPHSMDAPPPRHASQPSTQGSGLRVRGLTKRYGDTHAVEQVSFELAPGEIGVILGRSGSGKSTLLMILGGWLRADAGDRGTRSTRWEDVGYLPQRFGLLPELSVAENVALPSRIAGEDARVDDLLARLDLTPLASRLPAETSIGQQQRAALARALVRSPAVLLADEPTSHQDGRSADRAWQAIEAARDEGTACLVATHDTAAAARGNGVWEIVDGRLAQISSGRVPSSR
jgi:putative ABC transport system ATP-binding protein